MTEKTRRRDGAYPVRVAAALDAAHFGEPCTEGADRKQFAFGIGSKEAVAASLRAFADAVERDDVVLQEVRQITRNTMDDFSMRSLILRYAERVFAAPAQARPKTNS